MTVLDYILNGLEAELALERELGVREIEIDRALLSGPAPVQPSQPAQPVQRVPVASVERREVAHPPAPTPSKVSICFLHDRPLDAAGSDMMAKIVSALHETLASAPVVSDGARPRAKVYVALGALALRKWFPGRAAEPGASFVTDEGDTVAVTYSPNYILRFKTVTPAVQNIKKSMWTTIKAAAKRIGG